MIEIQGTDEHKFGKTYIITGVYDDKIPRKARELSIGRNHNRGALTEDYYLTVADGLLVGIVLNEEEMLELFAAFLAVKESYSVNS